MRSGEGWGSRVQTAGVAIQGKEVLLTVDFHPSRDHGGPAASWWDWAVEEDDGNGRTDVASGCVFTCDYADVEAEAKRHAEMIARLVCGVPMLEIGAIDAAVAQAISRVPENTDVRWDGRAVRAILLRAARTLRKAARKAAGFEGDSTSG